MDDTEEQRTIWCGNLSDKVTEEILYELFLQAGPVQKVKIPLDREGRQNTYGFVTFKHKVTVLYATQLLNGIPLFGRMINIKRRLGTQQQPQAYGPQQPVQIPYNAASMGINEINLGSMMKTYLKVPISFENQQIPVHHDRNYGIYRDNRRNDKPYAQNYHGRNHRDHYESYRGDHRSFYTNPRQRH